MSYTSCTNPMHKGGGEGALVMDLFLSSSQQTKLVVPGLKEDFGGGLV